MPNCLPPYKPVAKVIIPCNTAEPIHFDYEVAIYQDLKKVLVDRTDQDFFDKRSLYFKQKNIAKIDYEEKVGFLHNRSAISHVANLILKSKPIFL